MAPVWKTKVSDGDVVVVDLVVVDAADVVVVDGEGSLSLERKLQRLMRIGEILSGR